MNKLIPQFTVLLLAGWSINVWAFSCMDASGQTLHSMAGPGSVNVYVNLQPTIAV
ncbi:fimbrial protein, partial [Klebsiella pneumoniae]|nr:fimbrial protein [Klebsiella pneumoniae]